MKNVTNSLPGKAGLLACALIVLVGYKGFSQTQNLTAASPNTGFVSSSDVSPDIKNMLNYYDKQVYFTENKGQWDSKALYRADFHLGQAVATKEGMVVSTYDPANTEAQSKWDEEQEAAHTHHIPFTQPEPRMKGNSWMMNFINHSPLMTVEGNTRHNDAFNYFNGNQSQSDVYSYQEIWYNNVYDNVDVRYYPSKDGSLEYDMICKPGFDKNAISIKMDGISKVILKKDGSLGLKTSVGEMSLPTPVAYQNINGQRVSVDVHYVVGGDNTVTFSIGNFDASKPLLIDPIALRWASWLNTNSTGANHAHCVWIDAAGNIYTVSRVQGTTNLITGPFDTTANGSLNMIIAEYNDPDNVGGSGTRVWQSYVGGNNDNNPYAAQMGPDGNLYITGYTSSTNFPLIGGTAFSGPSINEETQTTDNIFVMKISPDGKSVKGAVIGGNGDDESYDLRFTSTGDVLVCGESESSNLATLFPGTGASNTNSGSYDILVFRINSNLDTIKWMKNYGGSGTDVATIMVDNPVTDDIFVAGYTTSSNFPTLKPRQSAIVGAESGFIEKLNSSGTTKWASYFDAASKDEAQILCMEFNTTYDELYFGGVTTGLDTVSKNGSNISKGAYQTKYGGSTDDFFVASMDTNQTFVAGTYVGGNGQEINMMGLNTDQNNDVYILGYTSSTNFPTTSGALQTTNMASSGNDNEVFLKLYTTLDSLEYSTYYGGSTDDYDPVGERGIKFSNCRIYTLVTSESNNIPLTKGALNTTKLSASSIYEPGLLVWSNPPDLLNNTITGSQFVCKGNEPTSFTGSVPSYSLPTISRNNVYSSYPSIGSSTVYQWQSSIDSINWTNIAGGTTQNLDSVLIGPLSSTTYFRRVISGDACIIAGVADQTITVQNSNVGGTIKNVSCNGSNNGSITAIPTGPSPYTFTWSTTPVQKTATASNLAPGTYSVTVNDGAGCIYSNSFVVTQPTVLVESIASFANPTGCNGNNGSATANVATGGTKPYTYSWSPSGGNGITASNLTAGTYTVTATDSNNCTATATVILTSPPSNLSASITSQTGSCFDESTGSATVIATGGGGIYTYSWNTVPVQTGAKATGLAAGTYTVTVTDNNTCTTTAVAIITQPSAALSASISAQQGNVSCFGGNNGSAIASVSGGTKPYSYSWNSSPVQTKDTAVNLAAGTYVVTITDASNCSTTATAIITQPSAPLSGSVSISTQDNVSCFGGNNGSAIASVSGGTKPYSYSWNSSPVQTKDTAANLPAGTYVVTITDANNCSTTANAIITQPKAALSASISAQQGNVSCFGGNNGSAIASVSGGTKPYSYSWNSNPIQTKDTAVNLAAGTYVVTITDANNCSTTANAIISQPSAPLNASVSTSTQVNVSCFGGNNGSVSASVSGGTQPYSYSWNSKPVQTSDTAVNLAAGTYVVTITDANNCSTTATAIITQPSAPLSASISAQQANVSCFGSNNGSAIASVSGGTPPYSYSWNTTEPVQTSDTAVNLTAGTYVVTVTDANNCSTTATAIITQPSAPLSGSVSISTQTDVSCFGGNNGSAIASVSGGTLPYSYSWNSNPVQTSDTAVNLAAGTYVVTITDANNCSTTATAIIAQPTAALSASIASQTNVSCFGGAGSASAAVSGGTQPYFYSWNSNPAQSSDTATNLSAGTYTVTVTDANNCTTTASVIISQPIGALSASINSQVPVSCFGGNTGSAIATANAGTPPYSYSWNTNPVQTSDTAINLAAGTYTVTVSDSVGCITTAAVSISQPQAALSASLSSQVPVSCFGNNNGSAMVTVNGGTQPYSYSWNTTPVKIADTANNLAAGTYTVTITDANNCTTTATAIISQPQAALSASITSQANVSCYGGNNGSATATVTGGTQLFLMGSTLGYNYAWNTNPVQTGATATNLTAGTYTVTVTDSNNCTTTATAIISQPQAALSASITSQVNVSCFGGNGSATVTATGGTQVFLMGSVLGYNYSWNTNPVQTGATATNLSAGTYTVTVTDSNNCTTTASVIITQPAGALNASITSQIPVSCFGNSNGSAIVTASAGTPPYTYSWNTTPVQTSDTAINLPAGTYMVTVTDSGNCITTAETIITQPVGALSASISSQVPVSCFGSNNGTATVTASAGTYPYTYSWNTIPVQTGATANNLTAGSYTVTVTDFNNCTTTASVVISQPQAALSASISSQSPVLCYASNSGTATVTVNGGTQPYSYLWNTTPVKTADTANNLAAGTYMVTITDSNSCSTTASVVIAQPKGALNVSVNASSSTVCNGSTTTLSASVSGGTGKYNYQWLPGSATTDSITVNPSTATTYTVTVTDSNGCNSNAIQAVNVNQLPQVNVTASAPGVCLGNNDTLNASGAVNYIWAPATGLSATTGASVSADSAETYTVTGTDANGCSSTSTVSVLVNPLPSVSLSGLNPQYCSNSSAVSLIGFPPPVPPKTKGVYSGTDVTSQGVFNPGGGITGGPYMETYTYTDSIGCSNSASLPVTIAVAPNVTIATSPDICLGNSDSLVASGGTSYTWLPSSGVSCSSCSNTTANPTVTSTYIVEGSNGTCSANDTVVVHVFSLSVNAGPDQHILYGSTAQITASGADTYVWTPGNTLNNDSISDPIASPTVTTTYIVVGRDSLGCISIDSIVIYVSNPCESLMVPSGFTPEASTNRYFHVLNVGGAALEDFKVFNRWGQMVYETNDINDRGWDGTFNGKPQPMGTYVYYTELLCQGQTVFIKGNITLIR